MIEPGKDHERPPAGDSGQPDASRAHGVPAPVPLGDPRALKALGHPVRIKVLSALGLHGPQNVRMLAEHVGEAANSVSYHLSRLAEVSLVVPADPPSGATLRERWWQLGSTGGWSWSPRGDDPEGTATMKAWLTELWAGALDRAFANSSEVERRGLPNGTANFGVWLTRSEARAVEARLDELLVELVRTYHRQAEARQSGTAPAPGMDFYLLALLFGPDLTDARKTGPAVTWNVVGQRGPVGESAPDGGS